MRISTSFWDDKQAENPEIAKGLQKLAEYSLTVGEAERKQFPNILDLAAEGREALEAEGMPYTPEQKAYGSLPNFDKLDEIIATFPDEAEYFEKHFDPKGDQEWRRRTWSEGAILYQLKFEGRLSEFAEEILSQYPAVAGSKGREISLFGLSGSGKSTVVDTIRSRLGENAIVMDSDAIRYNLFAKKVYDVESAAGASREEIGDSLIHNRISGALYLLANHVTKELIDRGYDVIQSGTSPSPSAEMQIYVEHPDGIDPRDVAPEDVGTVAERLYEVTSERVGGGRHDDYDWENPETVTRFEEMRPVTVSVPLNVHKKFIGNLQKTFRETEDIRILPNPRIDDEKDRLETIEKNVRELFAAG